MVFILKGGRSSTRSVATPSYEDRLLGHNGQTGLIERGAVSDKDISFILQSGDRSLNRALESKYQREKRNVAHVQRMYGNAFTNKDNDGNLYKDSDISSPILDPTSSKEDVERMENILKENL